MELGFVRKLVCAVVSVYALNCVGCAGNATLNSSSPVASAAENAGDFSVSDESREDYFDMADTINENLPSDADEKEDEKEREEIEAAVDSTVFPSTAGELRVVGNYLSSESCNRVQLRGISSHGIQWFPEYINQELFNELHNKWNANVVRLSMYTMEYHGYCKNGNKEELKQLVRNGIEYATAADLYVIVDWHILSDGDPMTNKEEAIKFFDEISLEYGSNKNVIYEICNEPNGVAWDVIREYAMEVIPAIRKNAPDSLIIVGTPLYCSVPSDVIQNPITEYENIMYSLHFYAASHGENIMEEVPKCIKADVPLFVTEFGICENTGTGDLNYDVGDEWIELLDKYGISYIQWNLANGHETSAAFKEECIKTVGFEENDLTEHSKWLREKLKRE